MIPGLVQQGEHEKNTPYYSLPTNTFDELFEDTVDPAPSPFLTAIQDERQQPCSNYENDSTSQRDNYISPDDFNHLKAYVTSDIHTGPSHDMPGLVHDDSDDDDDADTTIGGFNPYDEGSSSSSSRSSDSGTFKRRSMTVLEECETMFDDYSRAFRALNAKYTIARRKKMYLERLGSHDTAVYWDKVSKISKTRSKLQSKSGAVRDARKTVRQARTWELGTEAAEMEEMMMGASPLREVAADGLGSPVVRVGKYRKGKPRERFDELKAMYRGMA